MYEPRRSTTCEITEAYHKKKTISFNQSAQLKLIQDTGNMFPQRFHMVGIELE